jgi:hypothetical protein
MTSSPDLQATNTSPLVAHRVDVPATFDHLKGIEERVNLRVRGMGGSQGQG